jgi:hypothetical protein
MKSQLINIIDLKNWYVFDDLILQLRTQYSHKLTNEKMKPQLAAITFIEASIHVIDKDHLLKSYKDIESKVCSSSCLHRYDNYKNANEKQCYVFKPIITQMNRKINQLVNDNINLSFFVQSKNYVLRLTLHGDINQLNYEGQSFLLDLCKSSHTVLGYTSDVTKLHHDFSPYVVMSAINTHHVAIAKMLGYNIYYSGDNAAIDLKDLDNVIKCKVSIHSRQGCSTCHTPCGSSDYNIIAVSEYQKSKNKELAIKQGRHVPKIKKSRKSQRGFSDVNLLLFVFMLVTVLCGLPVEGFLLAMIIFLNL